MAAVRSLIAAHKTGDRGSLEALAVALAATVKPAPPLPADPVAVEMLVDTLDPVPADTWAVVRAARDYGDLTPAEYDYLSAAVEALTSNEEDQP